MLVDADWCWLMLIDAGWCWLFLSEADLCWLMMIDADCCWLMLTEADWCSNKVQPGFLLSELTSGASPVIFSSSIIREKSFWESPIGLYIWLCLCHCLLFGQEIFFFSQSIGREESFVDGPICCFIWQVRSLRGQVLPTTDLIWSLSEEYFSKSMFVNLGKSRLRIKMLSNPREKGLLLVDIKYKSISRLGQRRLAAAAKYDVLRHLSFCSWSFLWHLPSHHPLSYFIITVFFQMGQ